MVKKSALKSIQSIERQESMNKTFPNKIALLGALIIALFASGCGGGGGSAQGGTDTGPEPPVIDPNAIHLTADASSLPYVCSKDGATYILDADLAAPGTAIVIAAENITLDLNGHTVRYGTASRSKDCGIALYPGYYHANMFPNLPNPSPQGWKKATNTTIRGGSITQAGTGDHSDCIRGMGNAGTTIEDVRISFAGDSCKGIFIDYACTPVVIRRVQSTSGVTTIDSRHQGYPHIDARGYSKGAAGSDLIISDNTILGGCHLGIRVAFNPNAAGTDTIVPEISGNSILGAQSRYANDYGIQFAGYNGQIHNNTIDCSPDGSTPGFGRGVHIASARNCEVWANTVKVRERSNSEYSPYFTHGIKVEAEGTLATENNSIHDNDVTVYQYQESTVTNGGYGLNLADYADGATPVPGRRNTFTRNNITAIATSAATLYSRDVACVSLLNVAPGTAASFENNTFNSNQHVVIFQPEGAADVVFKNNTINKISPSYDWLMALFWPYNSSHTGHRFINNTYQNGAEASYAFRSNYDKGSDLTLESNVKITVKTGAGNPVEGASVVIKSAQGTTVYEGTTDQSGVPVETPLLVLKKFEHTGSQPPVVTTHTPFTLVVTKPGVSTATQSLSGTGNVLSDVTVTL